MQTTHRFLVYAVVILMCFVLYRYGGKLLSDKSKVGTVPQIEQGSGTSSSTSLQPSSTPVTVINPSQLSTKISSDALDDILNNDHDNISLDISNINIDGISKENITESDDFARLESSLCGETL